VFRSNQHIYVQVIDDNQQHTLAAASTLEPSLKSEIKSAASCAASVEVGKLIAQRTLEKGISKVVFDRGGNLYHGRVKALAEAAREAGLEF
jgi:large subunit ribosomal protein L18